MMNNFKIRRYKRKDFKYLAEILDEQWDLGKELSWTPNSNICAKIYAHYCIASVTKSLVLADENDKCIGYVAITKLSDKSKLSIHRIYHNLCRKYLINHKIKNQEGLRKYYATYTYSTDENFDCELELFIVDRQYRGKGFGKLLFNRIVEVAKGLNLKSLKIDTDESCSYGIYGKLGAEMLYKTFVNSAEHLGQGEHVFTYKFDIGAINDGIK